MYSAIFLAILNIIFIGMTLIWGAKYSLDRKDPKDRTAIAMPLILMLPRFILVLTSLFIGLYILKWNRTSSGLFVGLLMGAWVIIVTAQVIYVQHRLSRRREESEIIKLRRRIKEFTYENSQMAQNSGQPRKMSVLSRCNSAFIAYEARKKL